LLDYKSSASSCIREGLYKYRQFPAVLGTETAGVVVELPTDESVINNETYKSKSLAIGCKVTSVSALDRLGKSYQLTIELKALSWYSCNVYCSPVAICPSSSHSSLH
jgi:hypothetical protein